VIKNPKTASICRVIVNPKFRGQGLGALFCETLIKNIKSKKTVRTISLNTLATNKQAIACYQKVGFQVKAKKQSSIKVGTRYLNTVIMEKTIQPCHGSRLLI